MTYTGEYEKFNYEMAEFYKGMVEFYTRMAAYNTADLIESRKHDRELAEFVWSSGVLTELDMATFGAGKKYESRKTRKIWNERRSWYHRRKDARRHMEYYMGRGI